MLNIVLFFITIFVAFLAGSESHAQTKVKIAYAAVNARVAPMWVAQDQRFFTKYGIDVETIFVRTAPILLAAMASGEVQIGYTGGTAVLGAAAGGAELKVLANFSSRVTYDIVARSQIKSPGDLRGKRFGVQSIGGTVWMGAILGLEHLGLEPVRDKIDKALPFKLVGIDSDNGSEFINYHLKAFCDRKGIQFTRGRPYKKDDNAHIEQKNWTPRP